jgi:hypothetical protein
MRPIFCSFLALLTYSGLAVQVEQKSRATPEGVAVMSAGDIYKKSSPAVVMIELYDASGKVSATGSGFVVGADGRILTNYHVIAHSKQATVRLANGDAYDTVEVLDVDKRKDIALIKIKAVDLPYLTLGRSGSVQVGDPVFSLSSPLGLLQNTLSQGLISGIREGDGYRYFQMSAPISQGSSGGPVLNAKGEAVGIAFAMIQEGQNLNFAIPTDYARGMLSSNQPQPLAAFYEPEKQPQTERQPSPVETPRAEPSALASNVPANPSEEMKKGSFAYLERRLGTWTEIDARKELGSPVRYRAYEGPPFPSTDIYAYPDPTRAFREFELAFDKATKKLLNVYAYPFSMTWRQCRQLWGGDVQVTRNRDGTRYYSYRNRRLNIYIDQYGNVISLGVY